MEYTSYNIKDPPPPGFKKKHLLVQSRVERTVLSDLLVPLITPCNLQKVPVNFSDEEVKDNGKMT